MDQFCSTYFSTSPVTWKFSTFTQQCTISGCEKGVLEQAWTQKLEKIAHENSGPRTQRAAQLLRRAKHAAKIPEASNVCPIN